MRIHPAQSLTKDEYRVVIKRIRAGESLEEHQAARDSDGFVQPRRKHAVLETQLVLLCPRSQDVRFYDLKTYI